MGTNKEINEATSLEIAGEWEKHLLQMKICDVPNSHRSIYKVPRENLKAPIIEPIMGTKKWPYSTHTILQIYDTLEKQLDMQIRLYQDITSLLNFQLNKVPIEYVHYRDRYIFLKSYYHAYDKKLLNHIAKVKLRKVSLTKKHETISSLDYSFSEKTCKLAANCIERQPHKINQNILINNKSTSPALKNPGIYKSDILSDHKKLSNKNFKSEKIKKNKSLLSNPSIKKTLKPELQIDERLDHEELSELSSSENDVSKGALDKIKGYENRIDCYYTEVTFKNTNKEHGRRWQNLLNNGILMLNGKEYVFKEAKADLKFDRDQE